MSAARATAARRQSSRTAQARPKLRVVGAAPKLSRRRRVVVTTASLVGVTTLFGVAACHVLIAQTQFRLARMQTEAAEAESRYDRLRFELAELESPARIVAAAQERLGMVPPPQVTYLTPAVVNRPARPNGQAAAPPTTGPSDWSRLKPHLATRR